MPDPISWSHAAPYLIAAFAGSYLLGSVPFGLVITRLFGLGDIRKIGSGNIGATNVLRTGRKGLALATLICDSGKGALAVILAALWGPDLALIAALGSVLGHLFPVWLKFKGGKGVATTLGVVLALSWQVGLVACLTWLVTALVFRISSLSALLAMLATPLAVWFLHGDLQMAELTALLAVIVWARHHQNISRLLKGQEPRIGKK
ncbi:glycerol-3-phosphate 1-O-acyltransferase PlsY [Kiloniella laminariae]|uniref:glycerol-3-phosphate 1-O-acyltransferase PlsY n=1 Tax=Kiloniella laminariae TaxID=454162 RepID=UPI00037E30CE|nr:glycerol-3-phosphate 1-O-acyltransferase PlsY [Kiloniella laminariae]